MWARFVSRGTCIKKVDAGALTAVDGREIGSGGVKLKKDGSESKTDGSDPFEAANGSSVYSPSSGMLEEVVEGRVCASPARASATAGDESIQA